MDALRDRSLTYKTEEIQVTLLNNLFIDLGSPHDPRLTYSRIQINQFDLRLTGSRTKINWFDARLTDSGSKIKWFEPRLTGFRAGAELT